MKAAGASQDEMSFMENGTPAECPFFPGHGGAGAVFQAVSREGRFRSRRELERCRRVNAPAKARPVLRRGHEGRGGVAGRDELHGKRHVR